MGHSSVSPSGADRFFACPGSVSAQAAIELIEPSNEPALEGLAMHELAAKCLKEDIDPYDCIGETIEVKDNFGEVIEYEVNDDFAFTVRMYRNVILGVLEEHELDQKALQVETKFKIPEIDKGANGTTDCSFVASDTLYVFDLKSGRGIIVDPVENKQAMYYAIRPYLDAKMFIRKVVIGIIQPRAKEGDYIKMWETTPERIEKFCVDLARAIGLTRMKDPHLVPGEHCKYCRAAGNCPALHNSAAKQVAIIAPGIESVFPRVTELTAQQIGDALPSLEAIKGIIDNLMGYAFSLASKGEDVPNYSLVRGRKQRKYIDEQAVIDKFGGELGDDIYGERKIRTVAQLEKIVGKAELNNYVIVPEGDLKLVPTTEAKDFISMKVADVFKDVQLD